MINFIYFNNQYYYCGRHKVIFQFEKLKKVKNMLRSDCNGTLMFSYESEIVKNDAFLSKLEKKLSH